MKQLRIVAMILAFAGVGCTTSGTYDTNGQNQGFATATVGTGVFVNGTELAARDKAELDMVVGQSVPAGRYWMDASYNFGYEGQSTSVNLRDLYAAQHPQHPQQAQNERGMSMYSTDSAGRGSSIVSEGGCTILSTPSGSLSSGC
jgi:hypothetical protein